MSDVLTAARRGSEHPPLYRRTPYRADDWFSAQQLAEARRYARPLNRLRMIKTAISTPVLLAFTFLLDGGRWATDWVDGWVLQLLVGLFVLSVIGLVVGVGFDAYVQLVYDKRWDLSTTTPGRFAFDQVKSLLVETVMEAALFIPVYAVIRTTDLWWLYAWFLLVAVLLLVSFGYPVVIMPRFNKFVPLPDGELRTAIEAVAERAETPIMGVFTMDASKRTRRANAFVAGFGATKRVVLFDTILDYPIGEIEQVVAHEIGHYRLGHTLKTIPFTAVVFLMGFAFVAAASQWDGLLHAAGVDRLGDPASLPLFLVVFGAAFVLLQLVLAWYSRGKERAADLEALELLADPGEFHDLWRRLAPEAKAELEPSWWNKVRGSHPEVAERMEFAKQWAAQNGVAVAERSGSPAPTEPVADGDGG
jgi:STE24 endopeptidase